MATLLSLALALLMAAKSPNIPQDLRIKAFSTASIVLQYVQENSIKDKDFMSDQTVFGSTAVNDCVPNSILTLIPSTTSVDHVNGTTVSFTGTYSTGCDIDQNISWKFHADPSEYGSEKGTLSQNGDNMVFNGQSGNFVNATTTYSLTVGDTNQNVTIGTY